MILAGILAIAGLEGYALSLGINGTAFRPTLTSIGILGGAGFGRVLKWPPDAPQPYAAAHMWHWSGPMTQIRQIHGTHWSSHPTAGGSESCESG